MKKRTLPQIIEIPHFSNPLGQLGVVQVSETVPFAIKRVYFLHDVPAGSVRGSHAHKGLHQLIIPANGSFRVTLNDGESETSYLLDTPDKGLLIHPGYWRTLDNFSEGSVAMVLASELYDESDYIRDFKSFKEWAES